MTKGTGIVRYEGYGPKSGKKGMKNKRKKKVAQARFEERMAKIRKQREEDARIDDWAGEWSDYGED